MAIASTGAVSASDIRTEYGLSGAVSFSDLYRGGTYIKSKAANNNATNLAASVPTSGAIGISDFRGTAKGFRYTFSAGATNQDASVIFGSDYAVNYPKEIVIDSGVELGATSTAQEALQADSGLAGTLTITNNGTLSGYGGAAGGGAGGDAFEANVACTFINNGTIRGGGGGGGAGGTGGQGYYTYTNATSYFYTSTRRIQDNGYNTYWNYVWDGVQLTYGQGTPPATYTTGGYTYRRGSSYDPQDGWGSVHYYIRRESTATAYTSGGSGGAGGRGQGYGVTAASGSGGSAGGTNAGTGGTGGTGGSYGNAGGTGNTGVSGNYTGGSAGSGGGAAGKYIRGYSNVTFTNNGTVLGGTA